MNKISGVGIFLIIAAISLGILEDVFLSWLGVPSPSDIGEKMVNSISNEEAREIGMKSINSARILESLPFILFVGGIVIAAAGFLADSDISFGGRA